MSSVELLATLFRWNIQDILEDERSDLDRFPPTAIVKLPQPALCMARKRWEGKNGSIAKSMGVVLSLILTKAMEIPVDLVSPGEVGITLLNAYVAELFMCNACDNLPASLLLQSADINV